MAPTQLFEQPTIKSASDVHRICRPPFWGVEIAGISAPCRARRIVSCPSQWCGMAW